MDSAALQGRAKLGIAIIAVSHTTTANTRVDTQPCHVTGFQP
jgi:hypothetical protein